MPRDDLERSFPGLAAGRYRVTSPASTVYNCAACAAGDTERWWDPSGGGGYYWPSGLPRAHSLTSLIAAFATEGYEPCDDGRSEAGGEKVALYADEHGWPTHVARQLPSGLWTSKLGVSEDIEHDTPAALEGDLYGRVAQYLRRQRISGAAQLEQRLS